MLVHPLEVEPRTRQTLVSSLTMFTKSGRGPDGYLWGSSTLDKGAVVRVVTVWCTPCKAGPHPAWKMNLVLPWSLKHSTPKVKGRNTLKLKATFASGPIMF